MPNYKNIQEERRYWFAASRGGNNILIFIIIFTVKISSTLSFVAQMSLDRSGECIAMQGVVTGT